MDGARSERILPFLEVKDVNAGSPGRFPTTERRRPAAQLVEAKIPPMLEDGGLR
jgi:hypothetical protein